MFGRLLHQIMHSISLNDEILINDHEYAKVVYISEDCIGVLAEWYDYEKKEVSDIYGEIYLDDRENYIEILK